MSVPRGLLTLLPLSRLGKATLKPPVTAFSGQIMLAQRIGGDEAGGMG